MPDIQFVYFDLGNILVSFDPQRSCQNVADLFGVSIDQARAAVYESGLEVSYETGRINEKEFLLAVIEQLGEGGGDVSLNRFLDALGDMFTPIESMRATLQAVRNAGYRVGILSNTCYAHWDWVNRQDWPVMEGPFDTEVLSYEAGAMKPDADIYAVAEQKAGVPPESLLFLDDKQENIDAAIARGWQAVQCFGGPGLVEQLVRLGVISESPEVG